MQALNLSNYMKELEVCDEPGIIMYIEHITSTYC